MFWTQVAKQTNFYHSLLFAYLLGLQKDLLQQSHRRNILNVVWSAYSRRNVLLYIDDFVLTNKGVWLDEDAKLLE